MGPILQWLKRGERLTPRMRPLPPAREFPHLGVTCARRDCDRLGRRPQQTIGTMSKQSAAWEIGPGGMRQRSV